MTSRALDRVYLPRVRQWWESCAELGKALRRAVSVCETVQPYLTLTIRCQEPEGRSTRSPSQSPAQRNLGNQVKSPIFLHFFLDDDVGDGDSEPSEPEEPEAISPLGIIFCIFVYIKPKRIFKNIFLIKVLRGV